MDNYEKMSLDQMKQGIAKAGNCFYQYRPCQRNATTIYDIENIRHGVVFARTPLQMNDPFDSKIGFSVEIIYDECIDLALALIDDSIEQYIKTLIKELLKQRLIGETFNFINVLNKLKQYIIKKLSIAHILSINAKSYLLKNSTNLYNQCPSEIKNHLNKEEFIFLSLLVKDYKDVEIDDKTIIDAFNLEKMLDELENVIVKASDEIYLPFINDFLSKTTVTCFSASGWDNQLMWSHYANSYSGICVEYDFSKMDDFIGFVYPVKYSSKRPTIRLQDLGVKSFEYDENGELQLGEIDVNTSNVFSYLLSKNDCWRYEKEWRIINVEGEPYTPKFIETPFIKSITLGFNVDDVCKKLIWDVCQGKNIDCYQLEMNPLDYELTRNLLTSDSFVFEKKEEENYFNTISEHAVSASQKIIESSNLILKSIEKKDFKPQIMIDALTALLDFLSDVYYFKMSFNRYCNNIDATADDINSNEELCTSIKQLIDAINKFNITTKGIEESLLSLRITNMITNNQYYKAKQLIDNINELQEKHKDLLWFGQDVIEEQ